jgi:hypothetical protein
MDRTSNNYRRSKEAVEQAKARLDSGAFVDFVDLSAVSTLSPTAIKRSAARGEFATVRHGATTGKSGGKLRRVLVPADEAKRWLANLAANASRAAQRPELVP